jgi:hypothetical protein
MGSGYCPLCGTPRIGSFRFCRSCRFDYDSRPATAPTIVWTPTPAPTPRSAAGVFPAAAVERTVSESRRRVELLATALIVGVVAMALVSSRPIGNGPAAVTPVVGGAIDALAPEEVATGAEEEPEATPVRPTSYAKLNERNWRTLVGAPDTHVGKGYRVWACITQLAAATGEVQFQGEASFKKLKAWIRGATSTFIGDPTALDAFVPGDIVAMDVMALGSISSGARGDDTTKVPAFQVVSITRKGSCRLGDRRRTGRRPPAGRA